MSKRIKILTYLNDEQSRYLEDGRKVLCVEAMKDLWVIEQLPQNLCITLSMTRLPESYEVFVKHWLYVINVLTNKGPHGYVMYPKLLRYTTLLVDNKPTHFFAQLFNADLNQPLRRSL